MKKFSKTIAHPRNQTRAAGLTSHGPLALDALLVPKISKRHFFQDNKNSFHGVTRMGLEPHQNFFQNFFSTNMVSRGVQSFCTLEGATDPQIEKKNNSYVNLLQTYDEQTLKISSQYLEWFQIYGHLTEKFWQLPAYIHRNWPIFQGVN